MTKLKILLVGLYLVFSGNSWTRGPDDSPPPKVEPQVLIVTEAAMEEFEDANYKLEEQEDPATPCPATQIALQEQAQGIAILSDQIQDILDHKYSAKTNFAADFENLASFLRSNPEITTKKVFEGGLIDGNTGYRIDLTIYDMLDQIEFMLKKNKNEKHLATFKSIIGDDPIGRFPKVYDWFSTLIENDKKIKKKSKTLIVQLYNFEGFALPVETKIFTRGGFKRLSQNKKIRNYNKIMSGKNSDYVMQALHKNMYPDRRVPLTVAKMRELKLAQINKLTKQVNYSAHVATVNAIKRANPTGKYKFKMGSDGSTILKRGKINGKKINRTTIDLFNYVNNSNARDNLTAKIEQGTGVTLTQKNNGEKILMPTDVAGKEDVIKEIVSEDSWKTHVTMGDDNVLLLVRKWMKKNQGDIKSKLAELDINNPSFAQEVTKWKNGRRPSRNLTLDMYPYLEVLYPNRPWAKNVEYFDEKGRGMKIGANFIERTMRKSGHILKRLTSAESLASTATGFLVTSSTGNPYISAGAATLVHDKIYERKHGYEAGEYVKKNTPRNAAVSMVFASGFTGGKMSDAVFKGGVSGGLQAMKRGRPLHIGVIVGGATGATLQALPPGASKWVVSGDNKTANIVTEIAENATFTGARGAMIAYFDDGDWQTGLRQGAISGGLTAAGKIIILGPRYDAAGKVTDAQIDEYNHTHNLEDDHFPVGGSHFHSDVMVDRYGRALTMTREDLRRMNFRQGGIIGPSKGAAATNFGNLMGNEIVMGDVPDEPYIILHEGMHTIQPTLGGRANFLLGGFIGGKERAAVWEEYANPNGAVLPSNFTKGGYYIYMHPDFVGKQPPEVVSRPRDIASEAEAKK